MKQVIRINASSLVLSKCILAWHRTIIQGYKTSALPAAVVYGIALHKFVDTMYKTQGDIGQSVVAARKSFNVPKYENRKSPHLSSEAHLIPVCLNFWEDFLQKDKDFKILQKPDGSPCTEVTFEIKYFEDEQFVVYLCGTIDKLGQFLKGCFAIGDYKTTSSSEDESYLSGYEMSAPLRFYMLSVKLMAEKYPETILGKIGATQMGAYIDGIFLKPKVTDCWFRRSDVFQFKETDLNEFRYVLDSSIQKLLNAMRTEKWNIKEGILNGACEMKYSKCAYWSVCKTQNDKIGEVLLKSQFIQKTYDPLHHND